MRPRADGVRAPANAPGGWINLAQLTLGALGRGFRVLDHIGMSFPGLFGRSIYIGLDLWLVEEPHAIADHFGHPAACAVLGLV